MFPTFGPDVSGGAAFDPTLMTTAIGLAPVSLSSSGNGTGRDFQAGTGKCFAIQQVGVVTAGTLDAKIQESDDNAAFTDVASAAFTQVGASNNIQVIGFTRTKRYLRYNYTVSMAGSMVAGCAIAQGNQ